MGLGDLRLKDISWMDVFLTLGFMGIGGFVIFNRETIGIETFVYVNSLFLLLLLLDKQISKIFIYEDDE